MANLKADIQPLAVKQKRYVRILLLVAYLFGINTLGTGCASKDGKDYRKTFSVVPGTVLKTYNKNGDIEISSWDRNEVEVTAVTHSSWLAPFAKKPEVDVATGKEMIIRTLYSSTLSRSFRLQYRIKVPKGVIVAEVETATGNIKVENVSGDVNAKTSAGQIQLHKVNGFVRAVTSNGKINITGIGGLYEARNSTGDVAVEVPEIRDSLEIKSSNGSITASFAPNIVAQLEASTNNGDITYTNLPLTVDESSKKRITGKLGEGGNQRIKIKTSNGSVILKKL